MTGRRSAQRALWFLLAGLAFGGIGLALAESEPPRSAGVRLGSPEPPLAEGAPATARGASEESSDLTPPLVSIRVRVPATAMIGQDLEYRLIVENRSRAPAHHVIVRASAPTNATFVKATPEATEVKAADERYWQLGSLAAGATKEIVLVVKPTGEGELSCCARVAYEHGQCVRTQLGKAEIKRTGLNLAPRYDFIAYEVVVRNPGTNPMLDVTLREELPPGLQFSDSVPTTSGENPLLWKLGTIEPGRSKKVDYKVIAKELGKHSIRGVVLLDGKPVGEATTSVTVDEPRLKLEITGPNQRLLHRTAVYQITVTNPSLLPVTNVKIINKNLAASKDANEKATIAFVGADQGGKRVGNQVEWLLGTVKPGEKRTLRLELKGDAVGTMIHRVEAEADRKFPAQFPAQAETTTEFTDGAALHMEMTKDGETVGVGERSVCTLNVMNPGNAAATQVRVSFTAPEGLKVVAAKGPVGTAAIEGQRVTFAAVDKLDPNMTLKFTVELEAIKIGQVLLKADAVSDQTAMVPVHREETLTIVEIKK